MDSAGLAARALGALDASDWSTVGDCITAGQQLGDDNRTWRRAGALFAVVKMALHFDSAGILGPTADIPATIQLRSTLVELGEVEGPSL